MGRAKTWKRQGNETDTAFALFSEWLHAADSDGCRPDVYSWAEERSAKEAAETIAQWRSYIMACADAHTWAARAADYDDHTQNLVIRKVYPMVSPLFMTFYRMVRVELDKYEKAQAQASEAPGFIDLRLLVKIVDMLTKAEGKTQEFALREKEIAASLPPSEAAVDFSRLSLDEQRTLDALMAKAVVH